MRKKTASANYYKKLVGIVIEYVAASLTCAVFEYLRVGMPEDVLLFAKQQLLGIFFYKTAPYGWYVEMYLGLFLIIPYINMLYNNLESKRSRQKLIVVMLLLTAIPNVVNCIFPVSVIEGEQYLQVLPSWWNAVYPVTYYLIGAYLSEYPLEISKGKNLVLILLTAVAAGTLFFMRNRNGLFEWDNLQDYESLPCVIQAVLTFNFLTQCRCKKLEKHGKVLAYLSGICFLAYLVSYIYDMVAYKVLNSLISTTVFKLELYVIALPMVFAGSLITAAVLHEICQIAEKWFWSIWSKVIRKREKA